MQHGTAQSEATRLGENGRVRLKGGVPQQPWHNADGSLSGSDMTWLCGLQPLPPPPIPNKSLSSLADVQQQALPCQRAKTNSGLQPDTATAYSSGLWNWPSWKHQKPVTLAACSSPTPAWHNFLVWSWCEPDTCLHVRMPAPPRFAS